MTLRWVAGVEPLAGDDGESLLAESDAQRQLRRILKRYLERKIRGRSILVAGHRGAGKTTAVRHVVHQLSKELDSGHALSRRPLLVSLHGPDLFPPTDEQEEDPKKWKKTRKQVFKVATTSLYRSLSREFTKSYRRRLCDTGSTSDEQEGNGTLAAQFELDLDERLEISSLRGYWDAVDRLDQGILFGKNARPGQGPLEIVALISASRAYQRLTGREKTKKILKDKRTRGEESRQAVVLQAPSWERTLVGLFASSVLGLGLVAGHEIAGFLTAAGALAVPSWHWSRSSRQRHQNRSESRFYPDTSAATLERLLPILIDRLHEAGLSPVLMIDELDKVDNLENQLKDIAHHLKGLASAGVLICFLTDRDYFERAAARSGREWYPRAHTDFADHLLVSHQPRELHDYLRKAVRPADPAFSGYAARNTHGVLSYLLLCRCCLHPIDLRRELRTLVETDGLLRADGSRLRSAWIYRLAVTYQLAVERVLARNECLEAMEHEPRIIQPLQDALYYPYRQWLEGKQDLKLDVDTLRHYRKSRIRLPKDAWDTEDHSLAQYDESFLLQSARQLADLLCDLKTLRGEVDEKRYEVHPNNDVSWAIRECIPASLDGLLQRLADDGSRYRWAMDPRGSSYSPGATSKEKETGEAAEQVQGVAASNGRPESFTDLSTLSKALRRLNAFLENLAGRHDLGTLAEDLQLLPGSPSWTTVEAGLPDLEAGEGGNQPAITDEDRDRIREYGQLIERRSTILQQVLVLAVVAGREGPSREAWERAAHGLDTLGRLLRPAAQRSETELDRAVEALFEGIPLETTSYQGLISNLSLHDPAGFEQWKVAFEPWARQELTEQGEQGVSDSKEALQRAFWSRFSNQLPTEQPGGNHPTVEWPELAVAAAEAISDELVGSLHATPTLWFWTWLLAEALSPSGQAPEQMTVPAAAHLGIALPDSLLHRLRTNDGRTSRPSKDWWPEWKKALAKRSSAPRPSVAILVESEEGTGLRAWPISERYSALLASWETVRLIGSALDLAGKPFDYVFVHESTSMDGKDELRSADIKLGVLAAEDADRELRAKDWDSIPRIHGAQSIDEAVRQLLGQPDEP